VTISGISGSASIFGIQSQAPTSSSRQTKFHDMFENLKKEASKTPEERAKDGVLEKHGLSEDDYQALPKDQKEAISLEIQQAVRRVADQRRAGIKGTDRAA
jgi:hypothetical protein